MPTTNIATIHNDRIDHTETIYTISTPWSLEEFEKKLGLEITFCDDKAIEFDLFGIDPAIANSIRRIMIAEVPTMAIETVYVWEYQSSLQCDSFCSRLGLIPINADPRQFEFYAPDDVATDLNTIVFKLDVTCSLNPKAAPNEVNWKQKCINHLVTSDNIVWDPKGDQAEKFKDAPIKPCLDDIVLVKFAPGDKVKADLYAVKGIGKDHAKFSPVELATYRLLPDIKILEPIVGDDAYKFQKTFAAGVIKVEKIKGVPTAIVDNPRNDTGSRECLRHPEFEGKVRLGRKKDHFLFRVESAGQYPARDIVQVAIDVMIEKLNGLKNLVSEMKGP